MAKVGTSNPDRTISLRRLQCVAESKHSGHIKFTVIRLYCYQHCLHTAWFELSDCSWNVYLA